jgi:hypothetical protein
MFFKASDEGGARLSGVRTRILRRGDGDGEEGWVGVDSERGGVVGIEADGMFVGNDLDHSSSLSVTKIKGCRGRSRGMLDGKRSPLAPVYI